MFRSGPKMRWLAVLWFAIGTGCGEDLLIRPDHPGDLAVPEASIPESAESGGSSEPQRDAAIADPAIEIGAEDLEATSTDTSEPAGPAAFTLTSITPDRGPANGLTVVTVFGSGFVDGMEVLFGAYRAPQVFVISDAIANATAAPQPPGTVDVRAVAPDGREAVLERAFRYESALSLDFVSPASGPATGGTPVTIRGGGFSNAPLFLFGGRIAVAVRVVDDSTALALTPLHEAGPVSLIAVAGPDQVLLRDAFEYVETPPEPVPENLELFAISPSSGPPEGGTTVFVAGEGFVPGMMVRIGALPAIGVEVLSATLLKAVTPPGSPGLADVAVRVVGGEVILRNAFRYDPKTIAVYAMDPDTGSWSGGTRVHLYGVGLDRVAHVFFGAAPANPFEVVSPTEVVVRAPRAETTGFTPVTVFGDQAAISTHAFFFFDPALSGGGTWGGPARGDANVTVMDGHNGQRLTGAYVILGSAPDSPFQARTDDRGQVTFSAEDLRGPLSVTATKEGYTAYTLAQYDARNATVYVSPLSQPENPGLPPSANLGTCTVRGRIRDFGKYFLKPPWVEGDPYVRCGTTATSLFGGTPDPGPLARADSHGRFEMETRTGNFAVVCVLAYLDSVINREVPLRLGLAPGLSCSDPKVPIEGVEVSLGVEMDGELWVGVPGLPAAVDSLNGPAFIGAYDLGSDGFLEVLKNAEPYGPTRVRFAGQPAAFSGPLSGNGYSFYVTASSKDGNGMPYAVVLGMQRPAPASWPVLVEQGGQFLEVPTGIRHAVTAMQGLPDGAVLLATSGGAVYRCDGEQVEAWKVHVHRPIRAMYAASEDALWLAGSGGKVWRVNGGEVAEVPTGVQAELTGLSGWNAEDVHAVGGPFLLHFDGFAFEPEPIPPDASLNAVLRLDEQTVLAVGAGGRVLAGAPGGPFVSLETAPQDLFGVAPDREGGAWAVGASGTLVHWTPASVDVRHAPVEADLFGVIPRGPGHALVFGKAGTVLDFDGEEFQDRSRADLPLDLLAGAEVSGRVWLAGRSYLALPMFIPFPQVTEPLGGSTWSQTRVQWSFAGDPSITHHQFILSGPDGYPFWTGIARGDVRRVDLPDLAAVMGYSPIPAGLKRMNLTSAYTPGFTVDNYNSSHLNYYRREAFSVGLVTFE